MEMDENEFDNDPKARIVADPSTELDSSAMTEDERAGVEALRSEMRDLDETIRAALAVDVPPLTLPDLPPVEGDAVERDPVEPDTVGDDNVVDISSGNKRRLSAPAWLAMAAGVVLAAFVAVQTLGPQPEYASLAEEVVAHLDHEPPALEFSEVAVEERELAKVVNSGGADLDRDLGLITYAKSCVINGKEVPHLVMQGRSGPITLLLMPEERIDGAVPLSGESINGVILPVGDGSIAIIGGRDEDLAQIEQKVVDSVSFRI